MQAKRFSQSVLLGSLFIVALAFASPAGAQWVVHDPGNAILLIQQMIRQAQEIKNQVAQIQNQVQSLQNESRMLQHLKLSNAQQAIGSMRQIEQTLQQFCVELEAQGATERIGFGGGLNCARIAQQIRSVYPAPDDWHAQSDPQLSQFPDQWSAQQRGSASKAIQIQDASVANMDSTQQRMSDLASASRSAPGQTAATQVTNEMLVTLSAQLRDQQATELALQRSIALQQAEEAAEYERNKELVARASRDATTSYDVPPVSGPFTRAGN